MPLESCKQQMFDLEKDPFEENNLLSQKSRSKIKLSKMSKQAGLMRTRLMENFKQMITPARFISADRAAGDPDNFGGIVSTGWC